MSIHGLIGDILIRAGVVDDTDLTRATRSRPTRARGRATTTLGRALAELGVADESQVARTIASGLRLEFLEERCDIDDAVAALLPAEFCRKRRIVPLRLEGNRLHVAVIDPLDYSALQDVEFRTGKKAIAILVTQTWLESMTERVYKTEEQRPAGYDSTEQSEPAGEIEATSEGEYDLVDPATLVMDTKLPPIVRVVNQILSDAAKTGASDVHIEPQESMLQVRHRVDGLLREVMTIPHHLQDQVISRMKIISGMDIAERRKPQDGRSRLRFEGRRIDLRVSTLPTQFGEKVVIRLLNADQAILPMDRLGFTPDNLRLLQTFLTSPQGMILVTGPTGSGKTSTLYASLNSIKSAINNIVTLEDPIEFQVPGVNQMQVNARAGVTFASGLRSILRQDPNVILVGEIRDQETADIALQAAQTGHLLLSTLHTNDATATITRLFDLGVPPFLVASSLIGIVAQRLVRRVCPSCAIPHVPGPDVVERIGGAARLPANGRWLVGEGCDKCGRLGVKGRLAIHEMFPINDEVREMIAARAPELEIRRAARRAGMRTLLEDGIAKAAQGLTTLDDVLRVVSHADDMDRSSPSGPRTVVAEARPMPEVTEPRPMPEPRPSAAPADPPDTKHVPGRRVLVVEDSRTIAAVVKYFLELEGFTVSVAEDGLAGLEMAFQERPDMIVSDLNMPGMDGLAMIRALRQDRRTSDVRVLMLTSETSVESETQGFAAGADDYILKPVEPRRLAARVKSLLGRTPRAA
jgi:type IV pilus assembly protein PilB